MLENEKKVICKKSVIRNGMVFFEYGVWYKLVKVEAFAFGDEHYVLDRVDNGAREWFYDVELFDKYFATLKQMRKLKLDKLCGTNL